MIHCRWRAAGLALLAGGILVWCGTCGRTSYAAPSAQISVIGPGDVATPTPTSPVDLLPTPTPAPVTPQASPAPAVDEPADMRSYVVQPGDTLLDVALEIGVDLDDMPCVVAPSFRMDHPLVIGDTLAVLPAGWRCHAIQQGETIASIAALYAVAPDRLYADGWNRLSRGAVLTPGDYLRIPPAEGDSPAGGGFLAYMLDQPITVSPLTAYGVGGPRAAPIQGPVPKDWPFGSGHFMWPVYGWLSQGYRDDHRAVDIAANAGSGVAAADRGVVVRAGWNDQGYGNFVVIDHNIDYVTLYAHLDQVTVKEGQVVAQGQAIGTVGSTGNSTGPHLHFEIRDFGQRTNPLGLLIR